MAKYHINKNQKYALCDAKKRACRYGAAGHISQTEYDQKAEANDPRVAVDNRRIPKYLQDARENMAQALAKKDAQEKAQREIGQRTLAYIEENNIPRRFELQNSIAAGEESKAEVLAELKKLYIAEGVHPARAGWMVEDIERNDPNNLAPIKRSRDKLDPDIKAKTERAIEKAATATEYQEALQEYKNGLKANTQYQGLIAEKDRITNKVYAERGLSRTEAHYADDTVTKAQERLDRATKWHQAKIPTTGTEVKTERIKQEQLSVDSSGKINNAWVETDNGVEKIVAYTAPTGTSYGSQPGKLLTESGRTVYHFTHYANYRSYTRGFDNVIVSKKKGKQFKSDNFRITGSIDTGD
jgi:hypothetical protein